MPPYSRTVEEEGVLIDNVKLVDRGIMLEAEMRQLLGAGKYPARNVDQNIADLGAQIAANEKGVQELHRMVEQFSLARGAGLYGPCEGQCGGTGAPRARSACRMAASPMTWMMAP